MKCCEPTNDPAIDIIGSVDYRQIQFAVELPAPWSKSPYESPYFPQGLRDALTQLIRMRIPHYVYGLVPRTTDPKLRALLVSQNSTGLKVETFTYFVPEGVLGSALSAEDLLNHKDTFAAYRSQVGYRHVLLCVHGERDQCCGTLGVNLWESLTHKPDLWPKDTWLWRSTHIGGHKYAPTATEFHEFRWWGRLSVEGMLKILNRRLDKELVEYSYRGHAACKSKDDQRDERAALLKTLAV